MENGQINTKSIPNNPNKRYHFVIAQEFSVIIDVDHAKADKALDTCFGFTAPDVATKLLDKFGSAHIVVLARFAQQLVQRGAFDSFYCMDRSIPAPWSSEHNGIEVRAVDRMDVTALDINLVAMCDTPAPKVDVLQAVLGFISADEVKNDGS